MTDSEGNSSSNDELLSQFMTLKDTLIKNGIDLNFIKGTPLRKKTKAEYNAYFKEYMKDRYSTDPDYKANVKERSRKAHLLKKENAKEKT